MVRLRTLRHRQGLTQANAARATVFAWQRGEPGVTTSEITPGNAQPVLSPGKLGASPQHEFAVGELLECLDGLLWVGH